MLQTKDLEEDDRIVFLHNGAEHMGIVGFADDECFIVDVDTGEDFAASAVKLVRRAGRLDSMSRMAHDRVKAEPMPKHTDSKDVRNAGVKASVSLSEKRVPFGVTVSNGKRIING